VKQVKILIVEAATRERMSAKPISRAEPTVKARAPSLLLLAAKGDLLAEEAEVWVVAEQAQHDEVGIEAVEAVAGVGVAKRGAEANRSVPFDVARNVSRSRTH
jgi:hypothetical protein